MTETKTQAALLPQPGALVQDYIADICRGRRVLDVGCVDHTVGAAAAETWLHRRVVESAAEVLGVDLAEGEVAKLRRAGYNVIAADAQTMSLGQTFPVIVVGELIEHVDSPGLLLRNLRKHMEPGGRLVLSTPNPWYVLHWAESLFADPRRRWNPEHVAWFDAFVIENLMRRCGYHVESVEHFARSRKVRRVFGARPPRCLCSTVAVVATV